MMSQIAVVTAKVVAEAPWLGQGETAAKPKPEPSATRMSVTDAATNAPAMIADHDAADFVAAAGNPAAPGSVRVSNVCAILFPNQWCEHIASRRMIGRGTPSIQSRIPRPMIFNSLCFLFVGPRAQSRPGHNV